MVYFTIILVTYQRAVEKCKVAEYLSDLQTDREDGKRHKRKIIAPADDTNSDSDTSSKMTSKKQKKCHKLSDRQTEFLPPAPPTEFIKTISAAELSVQPHQTSQASGGVLRRIVHADQTSPLLSNQTTPAGHQKNILTQKRQNIVQSAKSANTDSINITNFNVNGGDEANSKGNSGDSTHSDQHAANIAATLQQECR
ncbi:uncharacterized protein LOC136082041 isoform X2 [Hydra vulgaris]|uniref:Uncharacterized protein LOC136082041 isoform X2 n=1 Tax=Hydra vulgaris TaxID=6087 RepID=A0ABM4C521_HYDVU